MKHTISVLVENHAGVLARISGLFARRGYNIHSLAVGVTDDEMISRITIVAEGNEYTIEQISKQLNKLVDVIKVRTISEEDLISRELILIKVNCSSAQRAELISVVEIAKAKIVDVSLNTITIEISDNSYSLNNFLEILKPYGVKEIVRTGTIAIHKGNTKL